MPKKIRARLNNKNPKSRRLKSGDVKEAKKFTQLSERQMDNVFKRH